MSSGKKLYKVRSFLTAHPRRIELLILIGLSIGLSFLIGASAVTESQKVLTRAQVPPNQASCPASQNGYAATSISLTFQSLGSGTVVGTASWAAGQVTESVTADVTNALANVSPGTPITHVQGD